MSQWMVREYGYGRFGTTRVHYRPSPQRVIEECRRIREKGYRDARGAWHPPWDAHTEEERRVECFRPKFSEGITPISTTYLQQEMEPEDYLVEGVEFRLDS